MKKVSVKKRADGARKHIIGMLVDIQIDLRKLSDLWIELDNIEEAEVEVRAIGLLKNRAEELELILSGSFEKYTDQDICDGIKGIEL